MSIPSPDNDDVVADLRTDLPIEVDEGDAMEQRTPLGEVAPAAAGEPRDDADDGDLAESAREVELDDDERDRA